MNWILPWRLAPCLFLHLNKTQKISFNGLLPPKPHLVTQHPSFMKLLILIIQSFWTFGTAKKADWIFSQRATQLKKRTVFSNTFWARIKTQRPRSKSGGYLIMRTIQFQLASNKTQP